MAKRNKNNKDKRLKQLGVGAGAVIAVGALGAGGVKVKNVLRAKKAAKDAAVATAAKQAGGKVSSSLDWWDSATPPKSPVPKNNASNVGGSIPKALPPGRSPSSPLVAAPVNVKGYNRGGKYITPYSSTRRKSSGANVSMKDIQRSRVQDVVSTAGTLSGAAITDGYTSTKTLARQAVDRRELQTMGGALAGTRGSSIDGTPLVEMTKREYNSLRTQRRRRQIKEDVTLNNLLQTANKSRRRVVGAERASRATETYLDVRKSNTSTVVGNLLARAKKDIAVTKNAYRKLKNKQTVAKQGDLVPAAFRSKQKTNKGFNIRPKSSKNMSQRQRDTEVAKNTSSELKRRLDKLREQGKYSSYTCTNLINF